MIFFGLDDIYISMHHPYDNFNLIVNLKVHFDQALIEAYWLLKIVEDNDWVLKQPVQDLFLQTCYMQVKHELRCIAADLSVAKAGLIYKNYDELSLVYTSLKTCYDYLGKLYPAPDYYAGADENYLEMNNIQLVALIDEKIHSICNMLMHSYYEKCSFKLEIYHSLKTNILLIYSIYKRLD